MADNHQSATVLEAQNVTKRFFGFKALDDVSFALKAGEIHGLMGENGAGKSTLIKVLTGYHGLDAGQLLLAGTPVQFKSPRESQVAGISAVYQEINLIPERSVAENIRLGREPKRWGFIDRPRMHRDVGALLERYGIDVHPRATLRTLGLGMQQMVAIARAMDLGAKVVILDEPTSALTSTEVELLFKLVHTLREDGVAILFVSHRLSECYALCDRLTILRDGQHVHTGPADTLSQADLINAMIGRERRETDHLASQSSDFSSARSVLDVEQLSWRGRVRDVSFKVRAGEIVGLVGLLGSGRTETFKTIFGAERADAGQIELTGTPMNTRNPARSIQQGLGFLPEDRRAEGIFPKLTLRENLTATTLGSFGRFGYVSRRKQAVKVRAFVDELRIKASGPRQHITELSGGNQQKVLLARCLASRPDVLMLDDPTRGIDVGAKDEVHAVIRKLAGEGIGVLVTSSEIDELMAICHRVIVIHEGRVKGERSAADVTTDDLLQLMADDETTMTSNASAA